MRLAPGIIKLITDYAGFATINVLLPFLFELRTK